MADLLERMDAAIDGRCPCGAEPREGSAYCSSDCEPTHVGADTDSPLHGGPHAARWRPDLVDDFDDARLDAIDHHYRHDTGLNYRVYTHRGNRAMAHLRVDDGHRYVGLDVPWSDLERSGPSEPFRRLERDLNDRRRLDVPDASDGCDLAREALTRHFAALSQAIDVWAGLLQEASHALTPTFDALEPAGVVDEAAPTDPRERALWLARRNRSSGPRQDRQWPVRRLARESRRSPR